MFRKRLIFLYSFLSAAFGRLFYAVFILVSHRLYVYKARYIAAALPVCNIMSIMLCIAKVRGKEVYKQ